ncbi:PorA family protein [Nocardioides dilutus]
MRRLLGPILVGIGAFLVVTGVLARFYAYPALAVAPMDQNSVTRLEAKDAKILDLATLKEVTTDMSVANRTVGDVKASQDADDGIVVWAATTSYRDELGNIRSRSAERYAFDAHTGEAINCCGGFVEETDGERVEVKRSGLISKYPFGTEKKDYKFWDDTIGQAVTTKFVKESEIQGLKVYEFKYEVPLTTVSTREVPASLIGESGTDALEVEVQYETVTQHWVEPTTGVIIDRVSNTANTLAYEGETKITTSGGEFQYTDQQVKDNVEEYKGKASSLQAVHTTVPFVGVILGLLLILGGVLLSRRNRNEGTAPSSSDA